MIINQLLCFRFGQTSIPTETESSNDHDDDDDISTPGGHDQERFEHAQVWPDDHRVSSQHDHRHHAGVAT